MNIRYATIDDLEEIVAIYNETVSTRMSTADTKPVTVESRQVWFDAHNEQSRPLWVAVDLEEVIGWVSFQSFYGRPAYQRTVEISIYVKKSARGQKLGERLLTYALSQCNELQIETVLGFIFGHNEPSINMFKKYGFEQWGHLPSVAVLDEVERDLLIFGKKMS